MKTFEYILLSIFLILGFRMIWLIVKHNQARKEWARSYENDLLSQLEEKEFDEFLK